MLIVIVVIAILAAITIVAYRGIQDRAKASAASSAASQARKKVELYKAEYDVYPTTLAAAGLSDSGSASYQYTLSGSNYCVTATSSNVSYLVNNSTTTTPTPGGCPGHGQGGVAAITNLAADPRATTLSAQTGQLGWTQSRTNGTYALINTLTGRPHPSGPTCERPSHLGQRKTTMASPRRAQSAERHQLARDSR